MVIDSSVALSWCFEDERTEEATSVLYQVADHGAVVPALWHLEVANGLQAAVRRGRIDGAYRDASIADLRALAIDIDPETHRNAWSETLRLADRFRLSIYDAAYLELAYRRRLPLASLDRDMRAAAGVLNLPLLGLRSDRK
jgi:predicted nucleic acid-binding protein